MLEAAHKALRRFVKETEALAGSDVDVVDPSVLRSARVTFTNAPARLTWSGWRHLQLSCARAKRPWCASWPNRRS